ncbi:MAG: hypothetical protein AAF629_12525 [Chloroflexota bacterium]
MTDMILNVNFPMASWDKIKGVHITRLGRRIYIDELIKRKDPKGKNYYWIGGEPSTEVVNEHGTDVWAIENNYISITPLGLDWTAHRMIEDIKRWHLEDLWEATNRDDVGK